MPDPVLIVGAGPTGLIAALELSRLGIPVRLVDKLAGPATTSRAIGVQARTLELLAQRGLAEEMVRRGNAALGGCIYGGGERLVRLDFTRIDSPYRHVLLLSQAETERILRDAIARHGVSVEYGVELLALSQDTLSHDASPVHVVLRHSDGRLEQAQAPWLISAEGAHSRVRATLDLAFDGKTLPDDYVLGDLHLDGDLAASDFHIFSSPHGLLVLFPLSHGHFRLIASDPLRRPSAGSPPTLEDMQALYDQRASIPARLHDLVWSSWFRINSRMVQRLRVGRLLLGGDAAHIHSPAGGQGMNTGIQDMINLGWKLAMVMQGRAPEALLATYEQDRLPVMRAVLTKTETLTDVMGAENAVIRGLVNHVAPWIGSLGMVQQNAATQMSQIAIGYRHGGMSANHAHGGALRAGDRVPDLPVRRRTGTGWQDTALHAVLDPSRFVLLLAGLGDAEPALPGAGEAVRPWQESIGVAEIAPMADEPAAARFRAAFGHTASAMLVRPDGYIATTVGQHAAAMVLPAYCRQWLAVPG